MTPEEFVPALRKTVLAAAVDAPITTLERPPGRLPSQDLVEVSRWFRSLSDQDQAMLVRALNIAARHATFGFLAVLDGSRTIEDDSEKGEFITIPQWWYRMDPDGRQNASTRHSQPAAQR